MILFIRLSFAQMEGSEGKILSCRFIESFFVGLTRVLTLLFLE